MIDSLRALERIEREAWTDLAAAAPAPFAQNVGLESRKHSDCLFLMASRIPAFQFNWLSGAGIEPFILSAMPMASAIEAMVEAVPIVMHEPADRLIAASAASRSALLILPVR